MLTMLGTEASWKCFWNPQQLRQQTFLNKVQNETEGAKTPSLTKIPVWSFALLLELFIPDVHCLYKNIALPLLNSKVKFCQQASLPNQEVSTFQKQKQTQTFGPHGSQETQKVKR